MDGSLPVSQMGEAAFLRRKGRKLAATALAKSKPRPVGTIKRVGERRGRNEPCPCGSGEKFKRCCGDFRGG